MKFHDDAETDSLYIDLADRCGVDSVEVAREVVLDLDESGRSVGIDIQHASKVVDPHARGQEAGAETGRTLTAVVESALISSSAIVTVSPRILRSLSIKESGNGSQFGLHKSKEEGRSCIT